MKVALKIALMLVVVGIAMIPLESWFRVFLLGRLYEPAPIYQSFFYILIPIAITTVAGWGILRIAKAKFDFS